jgi:hypothetical protein
VPPARQRRRVGRHCSEPFQLLFSAPPTHRFRPDITPAPRQSDSYGRFGFGIAVPDCRSIAIDRVHRLAGFLLVSSSKMPREHRTTAARRASHPGAFPIKANDHPFPIRLFTSKRGENCAKRMHDAVTPSSSSRAGPGSAGLARFLRPSRSLPSQLARQPRLREIPVAPHRSRRDLQSLCSILFTQPAEITKFDNLSLSGSQL